MAHIRGIDQLQASHRPSVVSIGNYDGVHLGHQHVIKTLLRKSEQLAAPSTVITFEPLAKEFFRPDSVVRLSSIEERAEILFALGVDQVLCIDFTSDFADYSPQAFVEEVLMDGLGVKYLCVGDDFRFGKDRAAGFGFLQRFGLEHSFEVVSHETFTLDGERVSSGRVRDALLAGEFDLAQRLLGRRYTISGAVTKGQQLGRTINFPTANIVLPHMNLPVNGVYAVTASLPGNPLIKGVANVGTRPTVDGSENRLEVHLFDFDADIYGQNMLVDFHKNIRQEQKFESFEILKMQIIKDAEAARAYLSDF
ncbi:MAG: riboflavin kinase/FMN adenylyltransferase [Cryomorphaceae bacterium]|jgi:riboflavin kinase/FMN adenylyltransferase